MHLKPLIEVLLLFFIFNTALTGVSFRSFSARIKSHPSSQGPMATHFIGKDEGAVSSLHRFLRKTSFPHSELFSKMKEICSLFYKTSVERSPKSDLMFLTEILRKDPDQLVRLSDGLIVSNILLDSEGPYDQLYLEVNRFGDFDYQIFDYQNFNIIKSKPVSHRQRKSVFIKHKYNRELRWDLLEDVFKLNGSTVLILGSSNFWEGLEGISIEEAWAQTRELEQQPHNLIQRACFGYLQKYGMFESDERRRSLCAQNLIPRGDQGMVVTIVCVKMTTEDNKTFARFRAAKNEKEMEKGSASDPKRAEALQGDTIYYNQPFTPAVPPVFETVFSQIGYHNRYPPQQGNEATPAFPPSQHRNAAAFLKRARFEPLPFPE